MLRMIAKTIKSVKSNLGSGAASQGSPGLREVPGGVYDYAGLESDRYASAICQQLKTLHV